MTRPNHGVIVGRFQVHELHEGHLELFRIVSKRHQRVIVLVGVAPTGPTRHNPLDFETRCRMIQAKFPDFTVVQLPDRMLDTVWSEDLDNRIRELAAYGDVTLYGGRDFFGPHYTGRFKPVELPIDVPQSGEEVRARLTNTIMESADFRAGIIHCVHNMFPRVVTCVDIAIRHKLVDDCVWLFARKPGEQDWRFVGGHAEPGSERFEDDAVKEVMEETGLSVQNLQYIGSARIDDWRWGKEEDKVKTLLFVADSMTLGATARDDIAEAKWFHEANLFPQAKIPTQPLLVVPAHKPLLHLLQQFLQGEAKAAIALL